MKINRIGDSERYKITSDWISDFADKIVKEGNYLDRIRERKDFEPKEKFATIEEKMEDIKARIGFMSSYNGISKEAEEKKDEKNNFSQKEEDVLDFIVQTLKYCSEILKEFPGMLPERVISKCRNEIPGFHSYEKYMDPEAPKSSISKMSKPKKREHFEHIPSEKIHDFLEDLDEE